MRAVAGEMPAIVSDYCHGLNEAASLTRVAFDLFHYLAYTDTLNISAVLDRKRTTHVQQKNLWLPVSSKSRGRASLSYGRCQCDHRRQWRGIATQEDGCIEASATKTTSKAFGGDPILDHRLAFSV